MNIVFISDLWGFADADWIAGYRDSLTHSHASHFLDARVLGGIGNTYRSKEAIHSAFLDFGIDRAAKKITDLPLQKAVVIGFSVGGVIAWRAALRGAKFNRLIAVSSTRLRYEVKKPLIDIQLVFGDAETHAPDNEWFEKMQLTPLVIRGTHDLYIEAKHIRSIIKQL